MPELLIRKLELRDSLSDEEKQVLSNAIGPARDVPPGLAIVRKGDHPSDSTLLLEGYTFRSHQLGSGGRQITSIHVPGDFVDLHSFLLKTMDHSITTLTRCKVAPASHDVLRAITETHPHLTRMLWLSTLIDAAIHRRWTSLLRQPPASQIAHLLCELYVRQSEIGLAKAGRFWFPLTQAKLADALGVSDGEINTSIQELSERRLVEWSSEMVTITDWDGLIKVAEFDPTYLSLQNEPR
jgi:CRP-like cAMP-binding protein